MLGLHVGYIGYIGGYVRVILGLYKDNGKQSGNYYIIIGYTLGLQSPLRYGVYGI